MYSIQRRNERFKIIYIYKIKEKKVPKISSKNGLTFSMHVRHGCRCNMTSFPIRGKARNARDRSFAWTAFNLWNSLPRCVRLKRSRSSKGSQIKFQPFTLMNPDLLSLVTLLTATVVDQILYTTTIETELLEQNQIK